ncbi:MAG TPA: hypothetical protein VFL83_09710 [Anaeromyxobacter sp.]|nr:hypothetical protein [Anaeromyxobacter sp.]
MTSCTHVVHCPLFAVFTVNSALTVWKSNYCTAEYARCARCQLSAAGKPVPQNLLPNGRTLNLAFPPAGRA